ncbi:PAS domain S-box protein [Methanolobus sp. ZRKC5]|uniref:PAS domain S-box protein n=1 Tax=unclassified Methanolobus TaxID=2629569 RepID=UPI00313E7871
MQLYDIMGKPGKLLKVGTMGQTGASGFKMLSHLALALLVISILAFFGHISIAKNVMLARLQNFIGQVGYVQKSGDLSSRITIDGNDDINLIADNINDMFGSLQEKEGNYRSLFEQSNDAIMIFDSNGLVLDANGRTSELLGYEKSILQGQHIAYLSPKGYAPVALDVFKETLKKGSVHSEVKMKLFDGNVIDADVSSSVIDKEKNTVQAIVRDVTEKKRSEKALLDAKMAAEIASRTKSEFISIMSHELRTPLTSIIGFSDILLEGMTGDLTEKQDAYLKNISSSGKCLLDIINNILDISKIESDGVELDFEIFNVSAVFEEIGDIIMPLTAKKNLSLNMHNDSKLSVINADRQVFKQIIYNLISNAIKFTPEGGNIAVNAELHDNIAKFSVKDNGPGIAKEDYDRGFR